MGRQPALVLLLVLAVGCAEYPYGDDSAHPPYEPTSHKRGTIESSYRNHIFNRREKGLLETHPEHTRYQHLVRTLREHEKEASVSLYRVIVGVPPDQREVGYLEKVKYPPVMLFNRDTGQYEVTQFEFNYVRDQDLRPLPRGVILGSGRTLITGRTPNEDILLGRFTLETGALILLHVCPCCGTRVHKNIFFSITRPDIDPKRVGRFKTAMVNEHNRLNASYEPVEGLPAEFWQHPLGHKCFAAYKNSKDYGFEPAIPVNLKPITSRELTGKKVVFKGGKAGEDKEEE
ncbi:MAG: hypothetical protein ACYTFG_06190 [Planctomycetota bacterium]|jgi:hypothetical protein